MKSKSVLYAGKAKTAFLTDDPDLLILSFRDDTSAFDGKVIEKLSGKGAINNQLNSFIMGILQRRGIPTHFEEKLTSTDALVKRLEMIPIECVIRNRAAGSLVKRLGVEEGLKFNNPLYEFFLKNDALHDPIVTERHIEEFGWATRSEVAQMRDLAFQINEILKPVFLKAGLDLIDFKLEFGRFHGEIMLGDEFSPDGCRLWDSVTGERMDKDRFRQGLNGVVVTYKEVANRLGLTINT